MDYKQKLQNINNALKYLSDKQLIFAIDIIEKIKYEITSDIVRNLFDEQKESYLYLLQYFIQGVKDEKREDIYLKILRKFFFVAQYLKLDLIEKNNPYNPFFNWRKKVRENNWTIADKFSVHFLDYEQIKQAFYTLVFTARYSKKDLEILKKYFENEIEADINIKSLMVSGIFLSLFMIFDISKADILFYLYQLQIEKVWERAIVSTVILIFYYNKKLNWYPQIVKKFLDFEKYPEENEKNLTTVILQLIKTKETPLILKKFHEEILPNMDKFSEEIRNIMEELEDLTSEFTIDDENPEWEQLFESLPDFMEKMQEFSMMQLEGSDVLMTAFDKLKDFEFFDEPMNWFIPYSIENPVVQQIEQNNASSYPKFPKLIRSLENTHYICDSDKYSFLFNIDRMPFFQKQIVIDLFSMEADTMEDIRKEDELLDNYKKSQNHITHFIQDLYRFFKLSPFIKDLDDIFEIETEIYNSEIFMKLKNYPSLLHNSAEMYFSKKFFQEAILSFEKLLIFETENEYHIYEKIAFAYQKTKNCQKALEYYKKAELYESNTKWISKKIGYCHLKLAQYDDAIKYFKTLEQLNPDDLQIAFYLGQCYYFTKDYANALKYFFKIEYNKPNEDKILRSIAWIYLMMKKFEEAEKYFNKISKKNNTDFIGLGLLALKKTELNKAVKYFSKSIKSFDKDFPEFKEFFEEQAKFIDLKINDFEKKLIFDAVLSKKLR